MHLSRNCKTDWIRIRISARKHHFSELWWLLFNGTSWKVCEKLDFSRKLLHFWNFLSGVFAWTACFLCDFMKNWKTLFRADSGRPRRHKVLLWGANLAQICLLSIGKQEMYFWENQVRSAVHWSFEKNVDFVKKSSKM